jgi:hypothetical protein
MQGTSLLYTLISLGRFCDTSPIPFQVSDDQLEERDFCYEFVTRIRLGKTSELCNVSVRSFFTTADGHLPHAFITK